tara:strand:+ start:496 stop:615 length:120 start_codon:yes stop_codon:yes gene_type:complete
MAAKKREVLKNYLNKKKTLDNFVLACDQIKRLKDITVNK